MTNELQSALMNDAIRYVHLLAVAIGIGTSFVTDATVFRRLKSPLSDGLMAMLHWCHKLVACALVVMWITGVVLIYWQTAFDWNSFSPKLISKVIVVSALTLNAMLIGTFAMPNLQRNVGLSPCDLSVKTLLPMALIAGVSTTGWLLALALGSSAVLKQSGAEVFAVLLPASYAAGMMASGVAVFALRSRLPAASDAQTAVAAPAE